MPGNHTMPQEGSTVLKGSAANAPARHAEESLQNSAEQQRSQAGETPSRASDALSLHRDTLHVQEAENPSQHTGSDLPAPELLTGVAQRTPLALEQFLDWAEHGNPTLKQAELLRQRTEQQGRQAALPPNPTVGYSGEHIRGGSYRGGEEGAYVQQTVVLGGKLGLRRDAYRQAAAAEGIGVEEQRLRVRTDVTTAFYRALTAQRMIAVRQKLVSLAGESVETSHRLANLGQADAPDVLQAEVELEQARIDFVHAQREYLQQFTMLAAVCNQLSLPVSPLAGDLEQVPELNAEDAVAAVMADSPSVRRAQGEAAASQARLKSATREPIPDLQVQAGEWYSGEPLEGITKKAGWMGFAQVGVELPLWNRNQGGTAAAKAEAELASADVARTRLMLKHDAEPLAQSYLSARFEAERYRTQMIPRAQRACDLYRMKYQSMAAAYPQVLASQRMLFNLQIAYLNALENEWMSVVQLQNFTLSGGLQQPVRSASGELPSNTRTGAIQ